jgi:hypothetical protein
LTGNWEWHCVQFASPGAPVSDAFGPKADAETSVPAGFISTLVNAATAAAVARTANRTARRGKLLLFMG